MSASIDSAEAEYPTRFRRRSNEGTGGKGARQLWPSGWAEKLSMEFIWKIMGTSRDRPACSG